MQTSGPKSASGDGSRRRDQIELDRLDLRDANLSGVKLDGDLTCANLMSANLSGATQPGYEDIWDSDVPCLRRLWSQFSARGALTDWTRAVKLLTYKQGAQAIEPRSSLGLVVGPRRNRRRR